MWFPLKELFHAKKTIGVFPNTQSCHVYIQCWYNKCTCRGPPLLLYIAILEYNSICDNLRDYTLSQTLKLFAYNARKHPPPMKTNKLINFRLNSFILYITSNWLSREDLHFSWFLTVLVKSADPGPAHQARAPLFEKKMRVGWKFWLHNTHINYFS